MFPIVNQYNASLAKNAGETRGERTVGVLAGGIAALRKESLADCSSPQYL